VDKLQTDIDKLNENASEEILKVEQKYNKQRQPLFGERSSLLANIPHFWITVFINHPQLSALMTEEDEEILQHLKKLEVQEFDDIKSGFKITMHFEKNPFFKNETITKEFRTNEAGQSSTKASEVEWHAGKNILQKHAAANKDKDHKRKRDEASLMRWFVSDEHDAAADELGELIKDEVWPNPLQLYLTSDDDDADDDGDADDLEEGADVLGAEEEDGDEDGDEPTDELEGGEEEGDEDGE
jgi:template-activating factor I